VKTPCDGVTIFGDQLGDVIQLSNISYSVLTSTDLVVWEVAGPATETAPGQFEFADAEALQHQTRFYRLRAP